MATFGHVDILVNAAGYTFKQPVAEVGEQEWSDMFDTNLNGALRACQSFYAAAEGERARARDQYCVAGFFPGV